MEFHGFALAANMSFDTTQMEGDPGGQLGNITRRLGD
jgi:hypothetical protein